MNQSGWRALTASVMVAMTGGGRTAAEALHGAAHRLVAHSHAVPSHRTDPAGHHHDDSGRKHGAGHHGAGPERLAGPVASSDRGHSAVAETESRHQHHESDQLGRGGSSGPSEAIVTRDPPALADLVVRRVTAPIHALPIDCCQHAPRPPTRAPPSQPSSRA